MTSFAEIAPRLAEQEIEVPSWAFGNSGTRFKVFGQPGVPRNPFEKLADAAQVHKYTGCARVALHIPWDRVDDYNACAVTPRTSASDWEQSTPIHFRTTITSWAASRTRIPNPPESDRPSFRVHRHHEPDRLARPKDLAGRRHQLPRPRRHPRHGRTGWRFIGSGSIARLGANHRLVLEYKFFEPAFYSTDVPDWGTSYVQCMALGERAGLPGHWPSRAGDKHRVHRRSAPAARAARLVRFQFPLLRRR